jgi:hypothetical protein
MRRRSRLFVRFRGFLCVSIPHERVGRHPRRLVRRPASPLRRLRGGTWQASRPRLAVPAEAIKALHGPQAFRPALLDDIAQAMRRIVTRLQGEAADCWCRGAKRGACKVFVARVD